MVVIDWGKLEQHQTQNLKVLFANDANRVSAMTVEQSGIRFDFSKTHLDDIAISEFVALSNAIPPGKLARRIPRKGVISGVLLVSLKRN